ncbi:MAG TPA: acyl-CoA dehydrogenase [Steroidobacteraceae bacterium]|jgi:acyl-CoA dehydrogenase|nr:acyl-CoA dehydrogenase [Steroidobacteraceae bacterium]
MTAPYEAPLALIKAAQEQAARRCGFTPTATQEDILGETAAAVLEGAARMAREVLSPLNRSGDAQGSRLTDRGVTTATGFAAAWQKFRADGWPALAAPQDWGGQALPMLIAAATTEIWGGANLAFAMLPETAVGAVEVLRVHGNDALRTAYVPALVSGEWPAAMSLTEPQAGSDLSTVRTLARPAGDSWLLSGRKIFISWGEHDLADNIVHLVLARTPDAPPGVKGLSLFLVPRRLNESGQWHDNDLRAVSLEHKMGIRASPTCVMALGERDGARGWLIGELHNGLGCMFTVMNHMRIGVGLHSTGLAERARQLALAYAAERRQGRDAHGAQVPIIEHADVRRMLLTMNVLTHAARCLAYCAAAALDLVHDESTPAASRARAERRLGLLTPLVKAWASDIAVEVSSLGVQVHGGTGYVDDCEASQIYRDARIGPVFEGTNFIQAQDLLARKILRDRAVAFGELLSHIEAAAAALAAGAPLRAPLLHECTALREYVQRLLGAGTAQTQIVGSIAYPFLQWLGVVAGGWQWALAAQQVGAARPMLDQAEFYAAHILPRARAFAAIVSGGSDIIGRATL